MNKSALQQKIKNERFNRHRFRLSATQTEIERHAMRLRDAIALSDYEYLPHEAAVATLGECEVVALKNVPGITLEQLLHARTDGSHVGAFAFRDGQQMNIVFNDVHSPMQVRVNIMEELFHLRLGHEPDIVSLVPVDGQRRTYCPKKESEAYGCGIAALVPFGGLHAMLAGQAHVTRIAEHFAVPVDVVHERIAATNLGGLANARQSQLVLVPRDVGALISSYR
jgi:hypothetical protein